MIIYETDSKKVKLGQIFVAIKGNTVDGHDYIDEAIKNRASKVIMEKDILLDFPHEIVKSTEEYLKNHIALEYQDQIKDLKVIGITGTNGKTTSCYLIYQLLKALGKKAAYIGTIGYIHDDYTKEIKNTTPDILSLYNLLLDAKEKEIEYIVMEVSSHSLYEERIKGLHFVACGFTNLTEDHLDFHKNMEGYLQSKLKILDYLEDDGTILLNSDDEYSKYFEKKNNYKTYGLNGDYKIVTYQIKPDHTHLTFSYQNELYEVTTNLTTKFNIYNYLNALGILHSLGFNLPDLIKVTKDIYPPKGRCETFIKNNSYIIVDYAHTPDAVEKVISAYRDLPHHHIITILGCGGDRDAFKRPIMGSIATKLSDHVIFTNDNPRFEDEKHIMNDIIKGNTKDNYEIIYNRKEAITKGISLLKDNDILLILGKGHENYQMIKGVKYHLDDGEIVKECLKEN